MGLASARRPLPSSGAPGAATHASTTGGQVRTGRGPAGGGGGRPRPGSVGPGARTPARPRPEAPGGAAAPRPRRLRVGKLRRNFSPPPARPVRRACLLPDATCSPLASASAPSGPSRPVPTRVRRQVLGTPGPPVPRPEGRVGRPAECVLARAQEGRRGWRPEAGVWVLTCARGGGAGRAEPTRVCAGRAGEPLAAPGLIENHNMLKFPFVVCRGLGHMPFRLHLDRRMPLRLLCPQGPENFVLKCVFLLDNCFQLWLSWGRAALLSEAPRKSSPTQGPP